MNDHVYLGKCQICAKLISADFGEYCLACRKRLEAQCDCCQRFVETPYHSRHGWDYCKGCYDVGCEIGNSEESCMLPLDEGPTQAEVDEAIAAIMRVGT